LWGNTTHVLLMIHVKAKLGDVPAATILELKETIDVQD
jgi:hypothetical protein